MNGRATDGGGANRRGERVSHFMKVPAAVASLRERHGEANARKVALTEQRRARRARSKKRFAFWGEVAARIKNGNCNTGANTGPADRQGTASHLLACSAWSGGMSLQGGYRSYRHRPGKDRSAHQSRHFIASPYGFNHPSLYYAKRSISARASAISGIGAKPFEHACADRARLDAAGRDKWTRA